MLSLVESCGLLGRNLLVFWVNGAFQGAIPCGVMFLRDCNSRYTSVAMVFTRVIRDLYQWNLSSALSDEQKLN
jgi:hypothetical protein